MIEIMFGSLFAMLSSPHIMGLMLIGVFLGLIVGVTPGIGGRLSIALARQARSMGGSKPEAGYPECEVHAGHRKRFQYERSM
jgi:hypothetical protein